MSKLEDTLREVALSRAALQDAKDKVAQVQDRIDATGDGTLLNRLKENVTGRKGMVAQDEAHARTQIIDAFAATGNKKPAQGASIRMRKRVEWLASPTAVRAWAFKNAPILLHIQGAAFDRMVEAGDLVPETIAKVVGDPSATLSRDLSSWLTPETPEA